MKGFVFHKYEPDKGKTPFDNLFDLFQELLLYTAGDAAEALQWMNELDREHHFTTDSYGMGDFVEDLKEKGFLKEDESEGVKITTKTEQSMRQSALEQIFGKLKKGKQGNHRTTQTGMGDEISPDLREYQFGDSADSISMTESLRNSQINNGPDSGMITERDLVVREREHKTQTSTVLMIDISHSMILYGEDRITPAKRVAMALAELVKSKYPKDTLDVIVFGNDAWEIEVKDLPYLQVGPFHTNTVAGLELAMDILRRRKNPNKQIFMITDGKPTCLKEGNRYYKNSFGLDRKIVNKVLNMAAAARRLKIPITTFMIAKDPWLQKFVHEFTETNGGRAFYTSLKGLGEFIFEDFERGKRRNMQ
jgi:Ca-activated chloride channel homolog